MRLACEVGRSLTFWAEKQLQAVCLPFVVNYGQAMALLDKPNLLSRFLLMTPQFFQESLGLKKLETLPNSH